VKMIIEKVEIHKTFYKSDLARRRRATDEPYYAGTVRRKRQRRQRQSGF
jgi:hypothetical protein